MKLMHFSAVPVAVAVLLAACVAPPPRVVRVPGPPPPPPQRVFVYPANGQSPEQTERDRYECHVWAVQQTGVDPRPEDDTPEHHAPDHLRCRPPLATQHPT